MKNLIKQEESYFSKRKQNISLSELFTYPQESLGFKLASFLYDNSIEANPIPEKEDIYRLLLINKPSDKEDIAMHYYLFGNGDNSLKTIFIVGTGALLFPHCIKYFYKKYRYGRSAFRFYDVDHFRLLHLPLNQIKDAFRIR